MTRATTMRAAILDAPDGRLSIETLAVPQARRGEALVRVAACGACHTDLHVMKGEYKFPYPCVLGHEVAGYVADLGAGVDGFTTGDRVVASFVMPCGSCGPCARGVDNLCEKFFGINRARGHLYDDTSRLFRPDGQELAMFSAAGLAEYAVVPATSLFRVPEQLSLESASIVGCSVLTAYGAIRHSADLRAGQTVAVVATGGVGSAIVQLAAAFGANQIIAVDVAADKLAAARRLGATHVVNAAETDPVPAVRELTAGRGVDVAFEVLGSPRTLEQAFMMTADAGSTVLVGVGDGDAAALIPLTYLLRHQIHLVGSYGGRPRTDMPVLLRMAATGQLDLDALVGGHAPMSDAETVYRRLDSGDVVGRMILVPDSLNTHIDHGVTL